MYRASLIISAVFALSLTASAETKELKNGMYTGSGEGELQLEIAEKDGVLIGSMGTLVPLSDEGWGGCAGGVSGTITQDGESWVLREKNEFYDPDATGIYADAPYCTVRLTPGEKGKLTSEEENGCFSFHGASCGFSGELEIVEQKIF